MVTDPLASGTAANALLPAFNPKLPWVLTASLTLPAAITNTCQILFVIQSQLDGALNVLTLLNLTTLDNLEIDTDTATTPTACTWGTTHQLQTRFDGANYSMLLDSVLIVSGPISPFNLTGVNQLSLQFFNALGEDIHLHSVVLSPL